MRRSPQEERVRAPATTPYSAFFFASKGGSENPVGLRANLQARRSIARVAPTLALQLLASTVFAAGEFFGARGRAAAESLPLLRKFLLARSASCYAPRFIFDSRALGSAQCEVQRKPYYNHGVRRDGIPFRLFRRKPYEKSRPFSKSREPGIIVFFFFFFLLENLENIPGEIGHRQIVLNVAQIY